MLYQVVPYQTLFYEILLQLSEHCNSVFEDASCDFIAKFKEIASNMEENVENV